MKKGILTIAILTGACYLMSSCGSPAHEESHEEHSEEMHEDTEEVHDHDAEGHDHAAMEEAAEGTDLLAIPENAAVSFANLEDGQTVSSPLKIEFAVEYMTVEPAGALNEGMGHHHIIIDGAYIERGSSVPADETNIHYGAGQTETELELSAGEHTLTMQFADGLHQSYGEQLSATITVVVE